MKVFFLVGRSQAIVEPWEIPICVDIYPYAKERFALQRILMAAQMYLLVLRHKGGEPGL